MKGMKVNVICVADRPDRLPLLVWSLVAQTHVNWELTIIDQTLDGNLPADALIAGIPEAIDRKIRTVRRKRVGDWGQTAKERAAMAATADAFMFPNDDAYYVPTALEEMAKRLEAGCDIAICGWLYDFMGYIPMMPSTRKGRIDVGGFMVRSNLFKKVGWSDKSHVGDAKLIAALIDAGGVVGTCAGTLYVKN